LTKNLPFSHHHDECGEKTRTERREKLRNPGGKHIIMT
jgi:hypothetical protein